MRHHNLLRLFKRNKRLNIQPHFRSHRSPLKSGYHFAFLLITSLLLATCGLNRSLAVPVVQSPMPQPEIHATATVQTKGSDTPVPAIIHQTEMTPSPVKSSAALVTPSATALIPSATALISLTMTLTPTIAQPAATSTPGVLATSDLLFISDNRLLRWDHVTHYSSNLAENVVAFSTNASGSKIVLLRPRGMAANGNELFDLDLLDFTSKQTHHLIEGTPRLLDLALSPSGLWLAFQHSPDGSQSISLMRLSDPTTTINLGQCEALPSNRCTPPAWSPDSQSLLWGDQRGLWIFTVGTDAASLLHTSTVEVPDPQGKTSQIDARFSAPKWSPAGRFALVQVVPNQSDASWHVVIDSLTGRMGQVLDSYKLSQDQVSMGWLPNGKLAVARSSDPKQRMPAAIQVWDVLATNPALLVSAGQYKFPAGIPSPDAASLIITNAATNMLQLDWIQQSNPGHLLFGAFQPDNSSQIGIYDLHLLTNSVTLLIQLPADIEQVLWAPDGSGMLITTSDGQVLFASADGKETFHLEASVGSTSTGFVWLPPLLRK
jgi:hypothetical protein